MKRERAEGPQLQADLQRGFRVRYLTQLHSSLPASLTPSFILSPPTLSFMRYTPLSLSFLSTLFPLTFAPKASLVVPIPKISKDKKDKSGEGRRESSRGNQRRINANKRDGMGR